MRKTGGRARAKLRFAMVLAVYLASPVRPATTVCEVLQLLSNADLDAGPGGGWVESGAYPIVLSITDPVTPLPVTPQSGNYAAWMGGVDSATMALYQDVAVPPDSSAMRVTGYRYITTEEMSGDFDLWTATIRGTGDSVLETLGTFSNADAADAWIPFSYTLTSDFAGQTIRLHLESVNDFSNITSFFVDSLALNVTLCEPALFVDDFESGDTSAWSDTLPAALVAVSLPQ